MEIICNLLGKGDESNRSISDALKLQFNRSSLGLPQNGSDQPTSGLEENITLLTSHLDPWDFHDWNRKVIVPFLCAVGILGNVLNLAVLGRRIREGIV